MAQRMTCDTLLNSGFEGCPLDRFVINLAVQPIRLTIDE
jgi:hypothetical protein